MTSEAQHAWDDHEARNDGRALGRLVRRLRRSSPTADERLGEVIAEHRRELEEQTRRFEEALTDLERREELLSDSRSAVERLLRLGTKDLDARESDVARLVLDLGEREARLREGEDDLKRRRSEVGAVELKRLALEQRERALDTREEQVAAEERRLATASADGAPGAAPAGVAFVPGSRYELVEIDPQAVVAGGPLVVDGIEYVVARVGRSPLPGDDRSCAFLLQRDRGAWPSAGSS